MPRFAIRNPYFIVVICLTLLLLGVLSVSQMPVDLFPPIDIPVVVVATFFSGMPPQDIETDITNPLERFFTMASGVDHFESRSMLGVSIIKITFQVGTSADADVTQISNLALADLKRLPPGTLPPVVLKFDASSLPVCLLTVKGEGLSETQLHDLAQFQVRNQIPGLMADQSVSGAVIPPPFGGKYRQVMVYVDPNKLFARQLSPMDVVNAVNQSNLILPAGDVKLGAYDYYVYSNSLVDKVDELNAVPLKTSGRSWVSVGDIGQAEDASQIQYNIVRVDGQKSAYVPIMKAGGNTNTIAVVNGIRNLIPKLVDLPEQLIPAVAFDQSVFVKNAIETVGHEALIGLVLTSIMILLFLGSMRATSAVLLSIPISCLATVVVLSLMGSTINTMILGGVALAFSRVIDNSVISLENIYRHLEMGSLPAVAAEVGGGEVSLAILAATLVGVVDFFPVTMLYGVSKFLFSALALSFCLALLASFVVALTVIPLFCSRFLKAVPGHGDGTDGGRPKRSLFGKFNDGFNRGFNKVQDVYEFAVRKTLRFPGLTVAVLLGAFVASLAIEPSLGLAFFPRTDAGQFTINMKAPTGTRIEMTDQYVAKVENLVRRTVSKRDLKMIVSNIGVVPDFSALYTTNAGPYTATVQVNLNEDHLVSTFDYMDKVQHDLTTQYPEVRAFFSSGSMVDAILNSGMPAPIDVQVASKNNTLDYNIAQGMAARIRKLPGVGEVYIPQDINYPGIRMNVDRVHAGELGLTQKDIINNVITALNSNTMIAPNYWVDYKSGNDYFLTVQYYEHGPGAIRGPLDLSNIPLRSPRLKFPTTLDTVVKLDHIDSPTEYDHYAIRRVADVYVTPKGEDLGTLKTAIEAIIRDTKIPQGMDVTLRGMVLGMTESFKKFALGFGISFALIFLILVAQFRSFIDPFLIMLAIPMGFIGVLIILPLAHSTLNVMSLMGVLMLIGISASNSVLIVDFAHNLESQGLSVADAVITSCRVRLRPVLITSLATIIGMIPMAMKLGTGAEQYAPMAQAIIGGLTSSVLLTIFIVPAAYLLVYGRRRPNPPPAIDSLPDPEVA